MDGVVPVERIELPTFGLQNRCSTAELNRQIWGAIRLYLPPMPAATGTRLRVRAGQIAELPEEGYPLPHGLHACPSSRPYSR